MPYGNKGHRDVNNDSFCGSDGIIYSITHGDWHYHRECIKRIYLSILREKILSSLLLRWSLTDLNTRKDIESDIITYKTLPPTRFSSPMPI